MKKEFCRQSDPLGQRSCAKIFGSAETEKISDQIEQVNEFNGSKILPKCSHVEPKRLDRWFARWKAVIYTSSLS